MPDLYQELLKLSDSEMYPLHMPGHKRNLESTPLKGAFRCDITEIDGFDNLHDETGIILEAEKRANSIYRAEKTFFLVNGSTSGILAAISAVAGEGDTVLAARGSHKAFYHAAYIRNINIKYLPYSQEEQYGIPNPCSKEEIENSIDESIKAVFITSPTYEGRCSDIEGIAQVCHKLGIPLIVDAAHGAHFGFGRDLKETAGEYHSLPDSAVSQGADIVIHSVHKTLPSMTQTALIHVQGNLVDFDRLKRFLRIYQSSSPSYVLMSSIDLCMKEMQDNGDEFARRLVTFRNRVQEELSDCRHIRVPGKKMTDDPSKVLICSADAKMTGHQIYDILREEYALQLEMAAENYALAIITGWDTEYGIKRLIGAIKDIDRRIDSGDIVSDNSKAGGISKISNTIKIPERILSIKEAWDADIEIIDIDEGSGRISGEFINLYPPGIPIITPGERFTEDLLSDIKRYIGQGLNVQGITKKGLVCVRQR